MYSAIALSLAAVAVAAPLNAGSSSQNGNQQGGNNGQNGRGQQQGVKYTANYDDLETGLLAGITGLDASDVAIYQGLDYEGFSK